MPPIQRFSCFVLVAYFLLGTVYLLSCGSLAQAVLPSSTQQATHIEKAVRPKASAVANRRERGSSTRPVPHSASVDMAVFGDMPYVPEDGAKVEGLIGRINRLAPDFVVHVGDIKSGTEPCDRSLYEARLAQMQLVSAPLFYTPGDNEWTDCSRLRAGAYDPLERLHLLRHVFYTAGLEKTHRLERQGAFLVSGNALPTVGAYRSGPHAPYVENMLWQVNGVVFATLHVVGSNNHLSLAGLSEFKDRQLANEAWLTHVFEVARRENAPAVGLFFHADPMLEQPEAVRAGFLPFTEALVRLVKAYQKPVLLVHGDSHLFRVDHPLRDPQTGGLLSQVTRVIVYGDRDVYGVHIRFSPKQTTPFTVETLTPED
ncbi:MAG: metallophosphoesterase [Candidatus Melainabacteria bacterium]|nr:metallophosphoesterase [Candidatus Melainabacteria bacterium]